MQIDVSYDDPPGLYTFTCDSTLSETFHVLEGSDSSEEAQAQDLWDWVKFAIALYDRFNGSEHESVVGFELRESDEEQDE